ncbi:MAG: hypothetical protein AB1512_02850 [Thermodesulfobacteriota bacterium]
MDFPTPVYAESSGGYAGPGARSYGSQSPYRSRLHDLYSHEGLVYRKQLSRHEPGRRAYPA